MIGFYVHHHGKGHLARTAAVLAELSVEATVLTSAEVDPAMLHGAAVCSLPLDVHPGPSPASLHYAPLGSPGLRARTAAIAAWAERERPHLLVVDVSVEVAVLGRLLGLPVVLVRQHGDRRDPAHRLGYDMAVSLLAPYPPELEDPTAEDGLRGRTWYAGLFSRFDGREVAREEARAELGIAPEERLVVVLDSAGGRGRGSAAVRAAADATPGWRWLLLGAGEARGADTGSADPVAVGWSADPFPHLRAADVVVASGGDNSVAEVLTADRPLVCVPEDRPFGEQHAKAAMLRDAGAAVVAQPWPEPDRWSALLDSAMALDPAVRRGLIDGKGARRAAAHLEEVAGRWSP